MAQSDSEVGNGQPGKRNPFPVKPIFNPSLPHVNCIFTDSENRQGYDVCMTDLNISNLTSSDFLEKYSSTPASESSGELSKEFQQLLLLSMLSSLGMDSSGLFGASDTSGSSSNLFPGMDSLMEQLLSRQIQSDTDGNSLTQLFGSSTAPLGKAMQLNQFDGEKQVGGDGINSNCGPTSLVMALHQQGLRVAGETSTTSSGKAIELARKSMAANSSYDGVDSRGRLSEAENNIYTDFDDLTRGAQAAGASARRISPTISGITRAIQSGSSVIISGTFAGKSPLPWMGDRGSDNSSAPGNAANHIVLVSGYNASTLSFTINDPSRSTPIQVSANSLTRFMEGNAGAMTIRK